MVTYLAPTADWLMREPVFRLCPRQNIARFLPLVKERSLEKGEVLHSLGEDADASFLIVEGAFDMEGEDGS